MPCCQWFKFIWPSQYTRRAKALLLLNRLDVAPVDTVVAEHCLIIEHLSKLQVTDKDLEIDESTESHPCKCLQMNGMPH